MELMRHSGCNWYARCSATSACGSLTAFGVRANVVFVHTTSGCFAGEIRDLSASAPRVVAISFCHAVALDHLLAVGYADGNVSVYDTHTRKAVRKCSRDSDGEVVTLLFGMETPDLLFVAYANGCVGMFALAQTKDNRTGTVVGQFYDLSSVVPSISSLTSQREQPRLLLVGGETKTQGKSKSESQGVLVSIDVRTFCCRDVFEVRGGAVRDVVALGTGTDVVVCLMVGEREAPIISRWSFDVVDEACVPRGRTEFACSGEEMIRAGTTVAPGKWRPLLAFLGRDIVSSDAFVATAGRDQRMHVWRISSKAMSLEVSASGAPGRDTVALCGGGVERFERTLVAASRGREAMCWTFRPVASTMIVSASLTSRWRSPGAGGHVTAVACAPVSAADAGSARAALASGSCAAAADNPQLCIVAHATGDGEVGAQAFVVSDRDQFVQPAGAATTVRLSAVRPSRALAPRSLCVVHAPMECSGADTEGVAFALADDRVGWAMVPVCGTPRPAGAFAIADTAQPRSSWRPRGTGDTAHGSGGGTGTLVVAMSLGRFASVSIGGVVGVWSVAVDDSGDELVARVERMHKVELAPLAVGVAVTCTAVVHVVCEDAVDELRVLRGTRTGDVHVTKVLPSAHKRTTVPASCSETFGRTAVERLQWDGGAARFAVAQTAAISVAAVGGSVGHAEYVRKLWSVPHGWSTAPTCLCWARRARRDDDDDGGDSTAGVRDAVVGGGADGAVRVWCAQSGDELARVRNHAGRVLCMADAGVADVVVSGGADYTLRGWRLSRQPRPTRVSHTRTARTSIGQTARGRE